MPPPHNHPSLHCWDKHKCRCEECRKFHLARNEVRARQRRESRKAKGKTPRATRQPRVTLDEATLTRLRQSVGLL